MIEQTQKRFAAVGECMIELSHRTLHELRLGFAGDTYNVAVYFARSCDIEVTVEYISGIGSDPYSSLMVEDWKKERIGNQYTRIISEKLPGLYFIKTDETGERSFFYYRSDSAAKYMFLGNEGLQLASCLSEFSMLYFSGITLAILGAESRQRFYDGLKKSKDKGAIIVFDNNYRPALWESADKAKDLVRKFCNLVTIALPSYDDEQALFGDDSMETCVSRYHGYGVSEVVVKQGKEGCLLSKQDKQIHIPAPVISNIVDTTAAGDSFNGAYLACRLKGCSMEESAAKAVKVAAAVISHPGAIIPKKAMPK